MVAELAIPYFIPGYSKMEIKCSYADCKDQPKDGFRSDADMIQHKERNASGHHYYCSVCDVDCRDWDDEVKHRVASPNHIACGTCGANLQSKSGLDRHVKQYHKAVQTYTCKACEEKFQGAGPLIQHLELGRCKAISKRDFHAALVTENFHGRALNHVGLGDRGQSVPGQNSPGGSSTWAPASTSDASSAWVDTTSSQTASATDQIDFLQDVPPEGTATSNDPVLAPQNAPPNVDNTTPSFRKLSLADDSSPQHFDDHFPALGTLPNSDRTSAKPVPAAKTNVWAGSSQTSRPSGPLSTAGKPWSQAPSTSPLTANKRVVFPKIDTSETFSAAIERMNREWQSKRIRGEGARSVASTDLIDLQLTREDQDALGSLFWNPHHSQWDASFYYNNIIHKFCCPMPTCEFVTDSETELRRHAQELYDVYTHKCAGCGKIFKQAHSLVSHMESPSRRCYIKSMGYEHRMKAATGGFLNALKEGNGYRLEMSMPRSQTQGGSVNRLR